MTQCAYSISWESHRNNICEGLSVLQQNGEFVDMTLAADGHHVKVHQMVMALASPYIKELISSANCPHPVIFMNKISYTTLQSILEYIYTGEVSISVENLTDLVNAARELHIKGFEDMNLPESSIKYSQPKYDEIPATENQTNMEDDNICYFEIGETFPNTKMNDKVEDGSAGTIFLESVKGSYQEPQDDTEEPANKKLRLKQSRQQNVKDAEHVPPLIQYTVSNQGSLQMILNRYVYYLKYSNRKRTRQWRCVDYLNTTRCPASVFTRDDVVVQRISAHTHPFHDKKILNKVAAGAVYTAILDAEAQGDFIKNKTKLNTDDNVKE